MIEVEIKVMNTSEISSINNESVFLHNVVYSRTNRYQNVRDFNLCFNMTNELDLVNDYIENGLIVTINMSKIEEPYDGPKVQYIGGI